ncbi:MAG: sulfatase maturase [Ponticaulis sp.]|nr:sulfatase maturase [Ponticaulis sp.]|tara:strand:- start:36552 stop:37775 length:1224 start_codon:yes stop_codon:yes gene_type:complete
MDDLFSAGKLSAESDLSSKFERLRAYTETLARNLSPEDCQIQSMPDASPTKWHLAHTTWFWEAFLLPRLVEHYTPYDEMFGFLFNSYYEAVGPRHARPQRGMITRPTLSQVMAYRQAVTQRVLDELEARGGELAPPERQILLTGIAHEEQHQELILTDIKHALFQNPFPPALREDIKKIRSGDDDKWEAFDGGITTIGHAGEGFAFDNEGPQHEQLIRPFRLAKNLVTNRTVAEFIADGGYDTASLWLSDGWAVIQGESRAAPMYWLGSKSEGWQTYTFAGLADLDMDAPAVHLDFYEANAIADWLGARLPTEFEWEYAARHSDGLRDLYGEAWQWTRSDYGPYPGYKAPEGAIGEYNGKFMSNQYVLRGSSCATTPGHERVSYRNFFPAGAQWQFTGLRLARDLDG